MQLKLKPLQLKVSKFYETQTTTTATQTQTTATQNHFLQQN